MRELRSQAALSLQDLSTETHFSKASLSRALSGQVLPTLALLRAIVAACRGDIHHFEHLWHSAAEERRAREAPSADHAESLLARIQGLYNQAGRPSLSNLATDANLGRTTTHRAVNSPASANWGTLNALVNVLTAPLPAQKRDSELRAIRTLWSKAQQGAVVGSAPSSAGAEETELRLLASAIEEAQSGLRRSEYRVQALMELMQDQQAEMERLARRVRELEKQRDALASRQEPSAAAFADLLTDQVRVLGPDHPDTLTTRSNLAHFRGQAGDSAGAAAAFADLLTDQVRVLGPGHPDTLTTRSNLAQWQMEAEHRREGEASVDA
ncbi:helix-turn-helix domain-containing protein [Streptomyces sp. NPDC013172]|uniref:helix-turn-helix domain-containing protein n=1 Tax=Streptomyces sp. NPDC013172 TaxID=3155009 RepID=UPI0033E4CB11